MAGRPCQPTNPPPKRYKPPILAKARPHGDLQQRNIQTKISNPTRGAGTNSYAASYRQISTNIGKPTMTRITGSTYPTTLQQNTHQVIKDQQELKNYAATLTNVKSNTRPLSSPLPTNHNPNDRPHEPILRLTPYHPPKMRKSISPTTLTPSSTSTSPQTTTLRTPQMNNNRPRLHLVAVTSNHAPATQNTIHSNKQPAPNTATTTQHPILSVNHSPDLITHPSTSRPKTFDSTNYSTQRPIKRSSVHPTEVHHLNATLCSSNYITDNHPPVSSHRISPPNDDTTNLARVSRHKKCPIPTTPDSPVSKSAPNSLLSTDPNPLTALKEALSKLNETVNRLFSIIVPLLTIVPHNSIESQKYDSISRNLPDIYKLMIALPPMTYDLLAQNNPTALLTNLRTNSHETTHSNFSPALSYHITYHGQGSPDDTLQKHLQHSPTYTKDLWKPP